MARYSTYTSPIDRMGAISQVGQGIQNQRLQREEAPIRQGLLRQQTQMNEQQIGGEKQRMEMLDKKLKETDFAANAYEALLAQDDTTMLGILQQRMPDFLAAAQQEQATPAAMRERLNGLVQRGAALGVIELPQQAKQANPQKVEGVDAQGNPVFGAFVNGQYVNPQTGRPFAPGEFRPAPKTGQTINNVLPADKTRTKLEEALDTADAERLTGFISEATEASKQNEQLLLLEELFDQGIVESGALEGRLVGVKNFMQDIGININTEGLAAQELVRSVANEMALRLRNPDSGLGLTGNTSDRDVQFLKETVPGLLRSEAGNKVMVKVMLSRNRRKQDVASLARDYARKNETMEGFDKYKESWLKANPMFSKDEERALVGLGSVEPQPASSAISPERAAELEAKYGL